MELLPYFLFCLIFLYFIAIIINSVMVYKILKSEGVDIGFFEYLFIGSMQFKFFRVLFGIQKISNKFYLKILRINFTVAMIILNFMVFCCLIFDVFSIKITYQMKVVYLSCRVFYKPIPSENLNFRRHFLFFRVIPHAPILGG